MSYIAFPRPRDAAHVLGDLVELSARGETVWLLDELAHRSRPFAIEAALRAEGFDPSAASRCYYTDGSVVAWCRDRLDARPIAPVIQLLR